MLGDDDEGARSRASTDEDFNEIRRLKNVSLYQVLFASCHWIAFNSGAAWLAVSMTPFLCHFSPAIWSNGSQP